jgi:predicted pyridoxine 5'-phosphate oxidase superfamily flavin-nucleotide-binding protein
MNISKAPTVGMRTTSPFHQGELQVQTRAGLRGAAEQLTGMLQPHIGDGVGRFAEQAEFIVVAGTRPDGAVLATVLGATGGQAQLVQVTSPRTVRIEALPAAHDPWSACLAQGAPVGSTVIDFGRRRRVRINGRVRAVDDTGFDIVVDQAYGNCPQYIRRRQMHGRASGAASSALPVRGIAELSRPYAQVVTEASTLFVASVSGGGMDVSHRGGAPGFVRLVDAHTVEWTDYPGNALFNTLGNLHADGRAALLFPRFDAGTSLVLTGRAALRWAAPGAAPPELDTGRRVVFQVHEGFADVPARFVRTDDRRGDR